MSDGWYAPDEAATLAALEQIRNGTDPVPTIASVLYPGNVHLVIGEPGAGKSLFCAAITAERLSLGQHVLWLDYEQGWRRVLRRLMAFGCTDHQLATQLHRVHNPAGAPSPDVVQAFEGVALVIADAFTGMLSAVGGSSNSDVDCEGIFRAFLRPFAAQGAAVAAVDHVAKSTEHRGRWAVGSQRKLGGTQVALGFEAFSRFRIGHTNRAKLTVAKDTDGAILPQDFVLEASMAWRMEPRQAESGEAPWLPTALMQKVADYLSAQHEPVSKATVQRDVRGNAAYLRKAIEALIDLGHITQAAGANRATMLTLEKPYEAGATSPTQFDPSATSRTTSTSSTSSTPLTEGSRSSVVEHEALLDRPSDPREPNPFEDAP